MSGTTFAPARVGPILALRQALAAPLAQDGELAALMGAQPLLHDEPPRGTPPVYAVFGDAEARDWSTGTDRGHEQDVDIVVWGRPGSAAAALAAADRMAAILDDAPLTLSGHRLVNLRVAGMAVARDGASNLARVTLRLSAVTEEI